MTNHWALIVGINQYQFLQPLLYAQQDALSLQSFLVNTAGFDPGHCILLSDLSANTGATVLPPTKEHLRQQLQQLCTQVIQPQDLLWVFFSGYGLHADGKDYLLPVEADPAQVAQTGIPIQELFEQLKQQCPSDNLVVVLDISRSASALAGQTIGSQAQTLAKDFGIPLFLSCQPGQFSHETMAVRHGLFTAALLEGMRYQGCVTLSHLAEYLRLRVPELSQHHWRPLQTPVTVVPPEKKYLMVVPPTAMAVLPVTESANVTWQEVETLGVSAADAPRVAEVAQPVPESVGSAPQPVTTSLLSRLEQVRRESPLNQSKRASLRNWGILAVVLVLLGVIWRNSPLFDPDPAPVADPAEDVAPEPVAEAPAETATEPEEETPEPEPAPEPEPESNDDLETLRPSSDNLSLIPFTQSVANGPGPLFSQPITPMTADNTLSALAKARLAVSEQRYADALIWLEQVPIAEQQSEYANLLFQAQQGVAEREQVNRELVDQVRSQLDSDQASALTDAIALARTLRPGEPYYFRAQSLISDLSDRILDLADQRATAETIPAFQAAIAAANLVPADRISLYPVAQDRINEWQRRIFNLRVLARARNVIEPGQASTFQQAIDVLQDIDIRYPEATTARQLASQWSQDILSIARARAAQGRYQEAIQAAQLVPENTDVHSVAQTELQRWQQL
jgi:uncharacterized caspase-like protein